VGREGANERPQRRWAFLLLLLPVAAVIYPPLYNHRNPSIGGVPFFVWYQLVAVVFGGAVTGVVYLLLGRERPVAE
jgi:Protein of unknown function (DUF3311)